VKMIALVLLLFAGQAFARAQHGTAENGMYPLGYHGDTFIGAVTAVNDASRTITLTYTDPKHGKTETMRAVIEDGYTAHWKDGTAHEVKPSDIPVALASRSTT